MILKALFPNWLKLVIKKNVSTIIISHINAENKKFTNVEAYPDGINLIGHVQGDFGLGESCRLLANVLEATHIPYILLNFALNKGACKTDASANKKLQYRCYYNINIIHINPNELAAVLIKLKKSTLIGRYNIGFWLWEQQEFPREWTPYFKLLDEIWTPSEFISSTLRKYTKLPVFTIPYAIPEIFDQAVDRSFFGLPQDVFLFMTAYNSDSVSERKNPKGVINAYKKAFSPTIKDVGLVLKVSGAGSKELYELRKETEEYLNIFILTESYTKRQINSLIKLVDVYVSLHRAEGFGLMPAEAMKLGTPVIATNWSANTEFMNEQVACMVDAKLVALTKNIGPYKKGTHWADPDLSQAVKYMRKLYEDRQFKQYLTDHAKYFIDGKLKITTAAELIRGRISQILSKRHNETR